MASDAIDWGKFFHEQLIKQPNFGRQNGKSWFQEQYQQQFYHVGIDHAKSGGTTFAIARPGPNGTIIIDDVIPYETRGAYEARDISVEWNDVLIPPPLADRPIPSTRKRIGERKRGGWRHA